MSDRVRGRFVAGAVVAVGFALAGDGVARGGPVPPTGGIIVDTGTVQPVPDPSYFYTFDVIFKPTLPGEAIVQGNSFTIESVPSVPATLIGTVVTPIPSLVEPPNWGAVLSVVSTGTFDGQTAATVNVTWFYNGTVPITTATDLGSFSIQSLDPSATRLNWTSTDNKQTNNYFVDIVPVPEPSSLALLGVTVPAAVLLRRRRAAIGA